MSERFFRYNRPGYPHPVSSELENSGIRVAVGDCSHLMLVVASTLSNRQKLYMHTCDIFLEPDREICDFSEGDWGLR